MKRFLDVLLSLLAIIFLSPLMLVICLIIICDDGMPVIFRQDRVGRGDKLFKIKKFRTMKNGTPNLFDRRFRGVGRIHHPLGQIPSQDEP